MFADGVGYLLLALPRTVRVPDASFVVASRFPAEGVGLGPMVLAPDIAGEVLSPSESTSALEEKIDDYLTCGTALIWVIDPIRRTVLVVTSGAPSRQLLRENESFDGGGAIPGFSCNVAELFKGVAR